MIERWWKVEFLETHPSSPSGEGKVGREKAINIKLYHMSWKITGAKRSLSVMEAASSEKKQGGKVPLDHSSLACKIKWKYLSDVGEEAFSNISRYGQTDRHILNWMGCPLEGLTLVGSRDIRTGLYEATETLNIKCHLHIVLKNISILI